MPSRFSIGSPVIHTKISVQNIQLIRWLQVFIILSHILKEFLPQQIFLVKAALIRNVYQQKGLKLVF